jgi:uncharacterized protein YqeY
MSIKKQLDADMKQAMKAREQGRVSCIRMLKAKLLDREVALRSKHGTDYQIADDEAVAVIAGYAKQRRDSIDSYRQGGRDDLVAAEEAELEIVKQYLPQQLSTEDLRGLIAGAITEAGAQSIKDLGAVMKLVMPKTKGVADGKVVNQLVREMLSPAPESDNAES